mmetsp:Transcript_42258/g.112826  ORF Transcript_42258/g.112826 Transcript_42258/m.112826 type:complete len:88 (+) Transcript_42258:332-595(+)
MAKYMTQSEIMSTLQAQAHIQPSLTCLVWQKLEEENSDTFFAYNAMVRAKDQIMAFNYLVEQQSRLMEKIGVAGPPDQLPMVHGMGL